MRPGITYLQRVLVSVLYFVGLHSPSVFTDSSPYLSLSPSLSVTCQCPFVSLLFVSLCASFPSLISHFSAQSPNPASVFVALVYLVQVMQFKLPGVLLNEAPVPRSPTPQLEQRRPQSQTDPVKLLDPIAGASRCPIHGEMRQL